MKPSKRGALAVLLALPGLGVAIISKPLVLGEGVLLFGLLLGFATPVWWLVSARSSAAAGMEAIKPDDRVELGTSSDEACEPDSCP
ncbi:MAG TPA: hypothetical protein PKC18_09730 [Lacipirellulaceae bacterium]|nr:hypothetical protein [Lacipirellulaceae bacterium]HMP06996.1 hypothetical protein [Lacipirellulaceae bacterium]